MNDTRIGMWQRITGALVALTVAALASALAAGIVFAAGAWAGRGANAAPAGPSVKVSSSTITRIAGPAQPTTVAWPYLVVASR